MAKRNASKKKPANKGRSILKRVLLVCWGLFFAGILGFIGFMFLVSQGVFGNLPSIEELENPESHLATELWSADEVLLGKLFRENRTNVDFDDLSPHLINALIATEDIRFYEHSGIDEKSLARVAFKTVILGKESSGGGSTISQQLAKNLFHSRPSSKFGRIQQKFKEWIIAARLEKRYTKEEILTMYLNTVEFVNLAHGIKSASSIYFNTTPDSLRIEQAALLVGMVKNPSLFNPVQRPDTTIHRRNVVLFQMSEFQNPLTDKPFITKVDYDSLKVLPMDLKYQRVDHNEGLAPYFREYIRAYLRNWAEENPKYDGKKWDIYRDGLRVYTTIDSRMQRHAEEAMAEHMSDLQQQFYDRWNLVSYTPWEFWGSEKRDPNFLKKHMQRTDRYRSLKKSGLPQDSIDLILNTPRKMTVFAWDGDANNEKDTVLSPYDSLKYYKYFLQAGFMAADPFTGEVLAYVGGIKHKYFKLDHVRTRRQVGSTFKPFIYTMAVMDLAISPCQKLLNTDVVFKKYQNWSPKNSTPDKYAGQLVELKLALANSINKITAKLMMMMGEETAPKQVIDLVRQMGVESEIPPVPSIALGTVELKLAEMVGAYTTYVNRGFYSKPYFITRIEDKYGNVIAKFGPEQNEVFTDETAYVMLQFLKEVVQLGTGGRVRYRYDLRNEIGGKTGTTQENSDGWFMGITPQLVTGTWVGADDPVVSFRNTAYGQGANMALPIFGKFMKKIYADKSLSINPEETFPPPLEPLSIVVDCSRYDNEESDDPYKDIDFSGGTSF